MGADPLRVAAWRAEAIPVVSMYSFYSLFQDNCMKKWQCVVCGFIYDEAEGWPDEGIAPGTRWEDVPADWQCPDCGVGKEDFEMIEMG